MSLSKYICCAVAILAFSACGGDQTVEKEPKTSTTFSFVNIEYMVKELGGSMENDVITKYPITIYNTTETEQSYIFHPENNIYERVSFGSIDTRAFSLVDEECKVKVPIAMSDDGVLSCDDGTRWNYAKGDQRLRPDFDDPGTEITIPAGHSLTLTSSFTMQGLSTRYKLHLKGIEFGEEVIVEGSWSGSFFVDYDLDYTVMPII